MHSEIDNFTVLGWNAAQWVKAYEYWNLCHKPHERRENALNWVAEAIARSNDSSGLRELMEIAKFWHERRADQPLETKIVL